MHNIEIQLVELLNMIEIVIYRIEIPTEDMVEGLPTKLNRFLNELDYHAEIIDSEGFEE
jgi:hypothetical protein